MNFIKTRKSNHLSVKILRNTDIPKLKDDLYTTARNTLYAVNATAAKKERGYKKLAEKKTKTLLPIIDDNEEKLANILEKGNDLLKTDLI